MNHRIISLSDPLWMQTLTQLKHDVFHLPEYLALEARRIGAIPEAFLFVEEDRQFFLPYLLRKCEDLFGSAIATDTFYDVISPYGYPGILLSETAKQDKKFLGQALKQLELTLQSKQVCSAFFRLHPVLNQGFSELCPPELFQKMGETVWIDLTQSHEEIWQQTRSDHRKDINRNKRNGFVAKIVPFQQYFFEFIEIYHETMDRVGANKTYYFNNAFFTDLLSLKDHLHLCIVEINHQISSACLIFECNGIVHSYLSGTKNQFLKFTPEKLLFDYLRFWAKERGNQVFHMGGGVGSSNDGVYYFKSGFSKLRLQFLTLRLIIDQESYMYLTNLRARSLKTESENLLNSGFFPAYRYLESPLKEPQERIEARVEATLQTV